MGHHFSRKETQMSCPKCGATRPKVWINFFRMRVRCSDCLSEFVMGTKESEELCRKPTKNCPNNYRCLKGHICKHCWFGGCDLKCLPKPQTKLSDRKERKEVKNMSINYRSDSPNAKPEGKRLISTVQLLKKQAGYRVELAEIGIDIADARIEGEKDVIQDLQANAAGLRRRIAVVGVRLAERITSVD